jgi:hypothetical protein
MYQIWLKSNLPRGRIVGTIYRVEDRTQWTYSRSMLWWVKLATKSKEDIKLLNNVKMINDYTYCFKSREEVLD